jgi:MFS family permease
MSRTGTAPDISLRAVFAGRRGRLLAALLLAEFAAAVQGIAYATVLPLASRDLDGSRLYGATLAAGSLVSVLVLAAGSGLTARSGPRPTLLVATVLYVLGVGLAATAPAMGWLLAGSALRGLAGGLLAAFGLSAIGGLFDDRLRPRVLALFSLVWLLPSLAGPGLNAAVALWAGWRWAMAWPAAVVVVARLLVGRNAGMVPWQSERRPVALGTGLLVVAGLVLASAATAAGRWGIPLLVGGVLLAAGAAVRVIDRATAGERSRTWTLVAFSGLGAAFFSGDGLIPLAVVEGLERSVVAGAVAIGSGLVAWSLTGLKPWPAERRPDPAVLGLTLLVLALAAEALAQAGVLGSSAALVLVVGAWAVAGVGIGLAYPRLSSRAFDDLAPERVAPVATAVAFAETTAVVIGSLLGAGVYSLATSAGAHDRPAIGTAFGVASLIALGAWLVTRLAPSRGSSRAREG